MQVQTFFDARTFTLTYLVYDPVSKDAVVIDPVLDFEPASGLIWEESVDLVANAVMTHGLTLRLTLETHAHADHLSGSQALKRRFGTPVAIGDRIAQVQRVFHPVFGLGSDVPTDGSQFDRLLADDELVAAGTIAIRVIATPGHTPACLSFLIGDLVFTGDALFMPDFGVGRCDFPAGSAKDLYHSVMRLYTLPPTTRVFVGHDYQPGGRAVAWESTIGEELERNVHLRRGTTEAQFVQWRTERDRTLGAPRLLLPSVQVNIDAGRLPAPEENGRRYLKIPLKVP